MCETNGAFGLSGLERVRKGRLSRSEFKYNPVKGILVPIWAFGPVRRLCLYP